MSSLSLNLPPPSRRTKRASPLGLMSSRLPEPRLLELLLLEPRLLDARAVEPRLAVRLVERFVGMESPC